MLRKSISIYFVFFFTISIYSFSFAALIQLKNGQKIEGNFVGASAKEIRIEVASQILKLKLEDVSYIVFDKSTPDQMLEKKSSSFESDAKVALRSLKAITSVVEGGVSNPEN
jgi:hypothetical protein